MTKSKAGFTAVVALSLGAAQSLRGDDKPRMSYTYAVARYSCTTYGSVKRLDVYSQVFGVCYQETYHNAVAKDHLQSADQAAQAACGGTISYQGLDAGVPYPGSLIQGSAAAQASAARDLNKAILGDIGYGFKTANFFVVAPYSGKCQP